LGRERIMPHALDSLEAFYACALAIEREAAERYREFAEYFAARGEAMLAALCNMLARMEGEHYSQLARAAEGLALPSVDLAAYGAGAEPPSEGGGRELFYRMQDPAQLLEVALAGEIRAQRFFAWAAHTAEDEHVRVLAREMAGEEDRHIRWVTQALVMHRPIRA
jgi:rubrerythrin